MVGRTPFVIKWFLPFGSLINVQHVLDVRAVYYALHTADAECGKNSVRRSIGYLRHYAVHRLMIGVGLG